MSDDLFDLTGRVALITGSTQGLGEATARVLAEHGAHVVISSRKQDACDEVAARFRDDGLSAEGFACNIGKEAAIQAIYDHLAKTHDRLDFDPTWWIPNLFFVIWPCFFLPGLANGRDV